MCFFLKIGGYESAGPVHLFSHFIAERAVARVPAAS